MSDATMLTPAGWVDIELPRGCRDWNGAHDCGRKPGHQGDHVCVGCHDQWNRGTGDVDEMDDGDEDFFREQREWEWPAAERCAGLEVAS